MNSTRLDGTDWHFRPDEPQSLGCAGCFLRTICGGLNVTGAALDCQRFCCGKAECEIVCFNSPAKYAARLKEIRGFDLSNIPRCSPVEFERVRGYAPLIHHAYSRKAAFQGDVVALSLFELLDRDGAPKYSSRKEIAKNFRIREDAKLLISGIQKDWLLERVWRSAHRNSIAVMLKSIGVTVLTPPNFSVYNNVPRPENLYNIKRIGLISQEFLAFGVPTALHINACTDTDYERYAEFLFVRSEFQSLAFDFITGPGYPSRMLWHIKKLLELRNKIRRPVQLVLRGGTRALPGLSAAFSDIIVIDSDPLHRALHRQRMIFGNDGRIRVVKNHLAKGVPVDKLLAMNVEAAKCEIDYVIHHPRLGDSVRSQSPKKLSRTRNANHEARQLDLLAQSRLSKARADSIDSKRVIAAPKSKSAAEVEKASK
jgi:hypothetical protein